MLLQFWCYYENYYAAHLQSFGSLLVGDLMMLHPPLIPFDDSNWSLLLLKASKYLLRHLFASTLVYKTVSSTDPFLIPFKQRAIDLWTKKWFVVWLIAFIFVKICPTNLIGKYIEVALEKKHCQRHNRPRVLTRVIFTACFYLNFRDNLRHEVNTLSGSVVSLAMFERGGYRADHVLFVWDIDNK